MDDEWFEGFCSKAAQRLKGMFETEQEELPEPLIRLLRQLRESECEELARAA